jgi:alginate O-acetyltransferase complex protein AlgJ
VQPIGEIVKAELAQWGGSWEAWCAALAGFHERVRDIVESAPAGRNGLIGRDGFLFFRGDVDLLLSGDLREQPAGRDPFPAIVDFSRQLREKGIDSLLVVIPTKTEVYPDKLVDGAPAGAVPYVAPYVRKLLGELGEAGVECVDLLPEFIRHRYDDEGLLYMPQDTHWTPRGLELAAGLIAERVRSLPGYRAAGESRIAYGTRAAECVRLGDICPMLSDSERKPYRPMKLEARQVLNPDGTPYTDSPDSPIVMLGDSFTGVFQLEDCRHAGLSAHVARELGMPIDLIMAHGSGPQIRIRLARRGAEDLATKRVVIWTVVSRDLYRYRAPWVPVPLP